MNGKEIRGAPQQTNDLVLLNPFFAFWCPVLTLLVWIHFFFCFWFTIFFFGLTLLVCMCYFFLKFYFREKTKRENKTKWNEKQNMMFVWIFLEILSYNLRTNKLNAIFSNSNLCDKAAFNMADSNCNILWKSERVYRCHFITLFIWIYVCTRVCTIDANVLVFASYCVLVCATVCDYVCLSSITLTLLHFRLWMERFGSLTYIGICA